jgi:hypothetical protein
MAAGVNATLLANLVDPEVLADFMKTHKEYNKEKEK